MTLIALAYAAGLVAAAVVLEWASAHTHRRSLRWRTAGFTFDAVHDHWVCPEGQHLWPHEYDHERRLVRYRARAHICNGCPVKDACTDSDRGREVVRPLDPWPHSEAGRFHRVIALLLLGVAAVVLVAAGARDPHAAPALGAALAVVGAVAVRYGRDLRRHPAGFPGHLPATGADGVRPHSRWASQR